jgi:hypothetical protein
MDVKFGPREKHRGHSIWKQSNVVFSEQRYCVSVELEPYEGFFFCLKVVGTTYCHVCQ